MSFLFEILDSQALYVCEVNARIREMFFWLFEGDQNRETGWGGFLLNLIGSNLCASEQGLAYVDFEDEESLTAAVAKNKEELKGRQLSIARSDPKGGRGGGRSSGASRGGRTGASGRGENLFKHCFENLMIEIFLSLASSLCCLETTHELVHLGLSGGGRGSSGRSDSGNTLGGTVASLFCIWTEKALVIDMITHMVVMKSGKQHLPLKYYDSIGLAVPLVSNGVDNCRFYGGNQVVGALLDLQQSDTAVVVM